MNGKSHLFKVIKKEETVKKEEKVFINRKMKREEINLLNSLFSVLKRNKRITESTFSEEEMVETKKENKQPALNIKEDKEETEDCSKIGETVNNDEDPERTITEDDIITENNNEEEDSDDEVIDINKI